MEVPLDLENSPIEEFIVIDEFSLDIGDTENSNTALNVDHLIAVVERELADGSGSVKSDIATEDAAISSFSPNNDFLFYNQYIDKESSSAARAETVNIYDCSTPPEIENVPNEFFERSPLYSESVTINRDGESAKNDGSDSFSVQKSVVSLCPQDFEFGQDQSFSKDVDQTKTVDTEEPVKQLESFEVAQHNAGPLFDYENEELDGSSSIRLLDAEETTNTSDKEVKELENSEMKEGRTKEEVHKCKEGASKTEEISCNVGRKSISSKDNKTESTNKGVSKSGHSQKAKSTAISEKVEVKPCYIKLEQCAVNDFIPIKISHDVIPKLDLNQKSAKKKGRISEKEENKTGKKVKEVAEKHLSISKVEEDLVLESKGISELNGSEVLESKTNCIAETKSITKVNRSSGVKAGVLTSKKVRMSFGEALTEFEKYLTIEAEKGIQQKKFTRKGMAGGNKRSQKLKDLQVESKVFKTEILTSEVMSHVVQLKETEDDSTQFSKEIEKTIPKSKSVKTSGEKKCTKSNDSFQSKNLRVSYKVRNTQSKREREGKSSMLRISKMKTRSFSIKPCSVLLERCDVSRFKTCDMLVKETCDDMILSKTKSLQSKEKVESHFISDSVEKPEDLDFKNKKLQKDPVCLGNEINNVDLSKEVKTIKSKTVRRKNKSKSKDFSDSDTPVNSVANSKDENVKMEGALVGKLEKHPVDANCEIIRDLASNDSEELQNMDPKVIEGEEFEKTCYSDIHSSEKVVKFKSKILKIEMDSAYFDSKFTEIESSSMSEEQQDVGFETMENMVDESPKISVLSKKRVCSKVVDNGDKESTNLEKMTESNEGAVYSNSEDTLIHSLKKYEKLESNPSFHDNKFMESVDTDNNSADLKNLESETLLFQAGGFDESGAHFESELSKDDDDIKYKEKEIEESKKMSDSEESSKEIRMRSEYKSKVRLKKNEAIPKEENPKAIRTKKPSKKSTNSSEKNNTEKSKNKESEKSLLVVKTKRKYQKASDSNEAVDSRRKNPKVSEDVQNHPSIFVDEMSNFVNKEMAQSSPGKELDSSLAIKPCWVLLKRCAVGCVSPIRVADANIRVFEDGDGRKISPEVKPLKQRKTVKRTKTKESKEKLMEDSPEKTERSDSEEHCISLSEYIKRKVFQKRSKSKGKKCTLQGLEQRKRSEVESEKTPPKRVQNKRRIKEIEGVSQNLVRTIRRQSKMQTHLETITTKESSGFKVKAVTGEIINEESETTRSNLGLEKSKGKRRVESKSVRTKKRKAWEEDSMVSQPQELGNSEMEKETEDVINEEEKATQSNLRLKESKQKQRVTSKCDPIKKRKGRKRDLVTARADALSDSEIEDKIVDKVNEENEVAQSNFEWKESGIKPKSNYTKKPRGGEKDSMDIEVSALGVQIVTEHEVEEDETTQKVSMRFEESGENQTVNMEDGQMINSKTQENDLVTIQNNESSDFEMGNKIEVRINHGNETTNYNLGLENSGGITAQKSNRYPINKSESQEKDYLNTHAGESMAANKTKGERNDDKETPPEGGGVKETDGQDHQGNESSDSEMENNTKYEIKEEIEITNPSNTKLEESDEKQTKKMNDDQKNEEKDSLSIGTYNSIKVEDKTENLINEGNYFSHLSNSELGESVRIHAKELKGDSEKTTRGDLDFIQADESQKCDVDGTHEESTNVQQSNGGLGDNEEKQTEMLENEEEERQNYFVGDRGNKSSDSVVGNRTEESKTSSKSNIRQNEVKPRVNLRYEELKKSKRRKDFVSQMNEENKTVFKPTAGEEKHKEKRMKNVMGRSIKKSKKHINDITTVQSNRSEVEVKTKGRVDKESETSTLELNIKKEEPAGKRAMSLKENQIKKSKKLKKRYARIQIDNSSDSDSEDEINVCSDISVSHKESVLKESREIGKISAENDLLSIYNVKPCRVVIEKCEFGVSIESPSLQLHACKSDRVDSPVSGKRVQKSKGTKTHSFIETEKERTKDLSCRSCNKTFKTYVSLVKHEKRVHLSALYKCGLCKISFDLRSSYISHMRENHSHLDLFVCKYKDCEESFPSQRKLRDHEKDHCKFECKFCKKGFLNKFTMSVHVKTFH